MSHEYFPLANFHADFKCAYFYVFSNLYIDMGSYLNIDSSISGIHLVLVIVLYFLCVSPSVVSDSLWTQWTSSPGSSVHGIFSTRMLEQVAIPFSRGSFWPREWAWVSHIGSRFFTIWATEAQPTTFCVPLIKMMVVFPSARLKFRQSYSWLQVPYLPFFKHIYLWNFVILNCFLALLKYKDFFFKTCCKYKEGREKSNIGVREKKVIMELYEMMCVKILKTVKHNVIERKSHSIKKKIKKKNVAGFKTQDYFL